VTYGFRIASGNITVRSCEFFGRRHQKDLRVISHEEIHEKNQNTFFKKKKLYIYRFFYLHNIHLYFYSIRDFQLTLNPNTLLDKQYHYA